MKKHFIYLSILIMLTYQSVAFAQRFDPSRLPKIGIVTGTVIDSTTGDPVAYASVSLISEKEQTVVTGGITDDQGRFHIDEIQLGRYDLVIEFIGYEKTIIRGINLFRGEGGGVEKNLGTIELVMSLIQMQELSVTGDLPEIVLTSDKLIYVVDKNLTAQGGTAEDVLNNVPMVTVDQDGEVALRGNSNVKMLVNGRPNRTGEGPNDVDNIPASLIDKVEVMTSPSAKYDPEGMAGIINIVLKKEQNDGLNGNLKINGQHNDYGSIGDMNGFTAYGNYKSGKWNLYSAYSSNKRLRNVNGDRTVDRKFYEATDGSPDSTSNIYSYDFVNESDRLGHSFKFGTDYYVNEQLIVTGELNYDIHTRTGTNKQDNILPFPYTKTIHEEDLGGNYDVEGFFAIDKSFDNPDREFYFSVSYDYEQNSEYEIQQLEQQTDSTLFNEEINGIELDASYKHPLNERSKIEIGYDGRINDNSESMDFQITTQDEDMFSGINTFGYKRDIHGLFLEFDYQFSESFSIKPSFRYEYVSKDISFESVQTEDSNPNILYATVLDSIGGAETYKKIDRTFYPDLHFSFNITDKQSLQFGLSKRVNRPGSGGHGRGSRQIRPFPRDVYSERFIFMGNPFLQPEYSTQYELSYKSPMPMGFAYLNLYYHQLEDVIEWYDDDRFEDGDVLTFRNAASGENIGVEVFTMIMGQTLGGGYNLSKLDDPTGDYELNGNTQRLTLYNRISLPEKYIKYFGFEFGFFFMKMTVPGGDIFGKKGVLWANTGISKSFLDETVTVSLGIKNLFASGGFQMLREKPLEESFNNGYTYATEITDVATNRAGRTWTLNINYRFGQMQEEKRKFRRDMERGNEGNMDMGY